jgi:1,4-dihydroxy-2-naphthoate octaprenyltransferase
MTSFRIWLKAFRLRTLPLAFSSILMGGFVAYSQGYSNPNVLIMALITTLFLQMLSNLANDYGDSVKGTDNDNRLGPTRTVQSGAISKPAMLKAIVVFSLLSLFSGIYLIYLAFGSEYIIRSLLFLLVGLTAIWAALKYTMGKNAYGYRGFGDVFVFVFFGLIAVGGTYFLIADHFNYWVLLPASTLGFFATGVLNLNNLRDHGNDKASGKTTLVVQFGFKNGKYYHMLLILAGLVTMAIYILKFKTSDWWWLEMVTLPLFFLNIKTVLNNSDPKTLDPELRKLALTTALFTLLFGLGLIL